MKELRDGEELVKGIRDGEELVKVLSMNGRS